MIFTPKLKDEVEVLDDPSIPLEKRKELLLELDRTNLKYGTYSQFCERFFDWLEIVAKNKDSISILEIGSGSGGLAREIMSHKRNTKKIDYSLMDLDPNILALAQGRLAEKNLSCKVYPSTEKHLGQFKEGSFDIIVSLHVVHHIHPESQVQSMFQDVYKTARLGFFIADFERRFGNVLMTHVVNTPGGLSKDLKSDGVKSVKRSYTANEMRECLKPIPPNYQAEVTPIYPFPHMIISGNTKL